MVYRTVDTYAFYLKKIQPDIIFSCKSWSRSIKTSTCPKMSHIGYEKVSAIQFEWKTDFNWYYIFLWSVCIWSFYNLGQVCVK